MLRTFASDRAVQRTLALLLATFVYALTVLKTVRNDSQSSVEFVPRIAVTVSYLLAMASVVGLALFLVHLVRQIRIETMLDQVSADIRHTAERVLDRERLHRPGVRAGSVRAAGERRRRSALHGDEQPSGRQ